MFLDWIQDVFSGKQFEDKEQKRKPSTTLQQVAERLKIKGYVIKEVTDKDLTAINKHCFLSRVYLTITKEGKEYSIFYDTRASIGAYVLGFILFAWIAIGRTWTLSEINKRTHADAFEAVYGVRCKER